MDRRKYSAYLSDCLANLRNSTDRHLLHCDCHSSTCHCNLYNAIVIAQHTIAISTMPLQPIQCDCHGSTCHCESIQCHCNLYNAIAADTIRLRVDTMPLRPATMPYSRSVAKKICTTLVLYPSFLYAIRYWFFPTGNSSVSRLKVRTLIREVDSDPNQLTRSLIVAEGRALMILDRKL
jgi:hypothetical protein